MLFKNDLHVWATITYTLFISVTFDNFGVLKGEEGFCPISNADIETDGDNCGPGPTVSHKQDPIRYVLYDVNSPEGFNLRRDVYMRMAIFVKRLNEKSEWRLVLPPWTHLYHWQSTELHEQTHLPWSMFFDVNSLKRFAPVIEFHELLKKWSETGRNVINQVFVLQHFKDMWSENKEWKDKWAVEPCLDNIPYVKTVDKRFSGSFWNYKNVSAEKVDCLSFQGPASQLASVLKNIDAQSVMFDHAEIALHDLYGQVEYWQARRSMRFAKKLVKLADDFRREFLNSTDEDDGTVSVSDWTEELPKHQAKGGPYLGIHLRRKDFLWGRPLEVPSIESAANQIRKHLDNLGLKKVFIATDTSDNEFLELKLLLASYEVYRFHPTEKLKGEIKDGGVAIVDQIICSHASYFSGTHESTFSFRIQEEREILGFDSETTFNRLCGKNPECTQPTRWTIVY